jgi:hypothetical protein
VVHLPEEHAKVRALRLEQLARRGELLHLVRVRVRVRARVRVGLGLGLG